MTQSARLSRYQQLLRIRLVEEKIVELYPEQEMRCPVHLSIGQEGIAVGVCAALSARDLVLSGHRNHAHYLAKGGSLKRMFAEIYGKETGCSRGRGGSMHLTDMDAGFLGATPIVGSTIPIAVGAALTATMRGDKRVVAVFLGDGATETGVFHESLNFALVKNLPVLFVCENNFYSVYSPLEVRQPHDRPMTKLAAGHGMKVESGNGNDVEGVYAISVRAAANARNGGGPVFLEFDTYRWREHCGPNFDNELGYRPVEEFERWHDMDPLAAAQSALQADMTLMPDDVDSFKRVIAAEIDEAVKFAKESPFPPPSTLHEGVYA